MTEHDQIDIHAKDEEFETVQPGEDHGAKEVAPGQEPEQDAGLESAVEGSVEAQEKPASEQPQEEELSEADLLRAELEQAQARVDEYLDGWQRARAEFANYRRREEQRRQQIEDAIKGQVLSGLLPVMDDMDRAFQAVPPDVCETAWVKGLSLVGHKLQSNLEKAGVAPMATQPGDVFDPSYHQAVFHGPSAEYPEGRIVEVFQRGYTLGETVLRPAMVYVSSGAPEKPCADGESGDEPAADVPGDEGT
jgi:molecular chaperone GrpE